jgi:DNA invertase Pin-like site-specific DNA recombinase
MKRAIAIRRVSRVGKRDREKFSSPQDQRDGIAKLGSEQGWKVDYPEPELDVSGNALLEDRPQLSRAVMAVQAGSAQVIVAADTSRLWWNPETAALVKRLVEDAGGEIWTVDSGRISDEEPADELNGTVQLAAGRFSRRQNAKKSRDGVQRALDNGVPPFSLVPGLVRVDDHIEIDEDVAPIIRNAVWIRVQGHKVEHVRSYLRVHGIERSFHGTAYLLRSRLLVGDIVVNDKKVGECPAILQTTDGKPDVDLFNAVQDVKLTKGRKPLNDCRRLLSALGVLVCSSCGARMGASSQTQGGRYYPLYRCGSADCPARLTVMAEPAERVVTEAARSAVDGFVAFKAAKENVRNARLALEAAQANLDAAIAVVGDWTEPAVAKRLAELRATRDRAKETVDSLGVPDDDVIVLLGKQWDTLSVTDQRRCIKATIARAVVEPFEKGMKPEERITVHYHGEGFDFRKVDQAIRKHLPTYLT